MVEATRLRRRPEARAFAVETLLQLVQDGKLRIPEFQRPQRWRSRHVLSLFDSVVNGFPIGEFLFSRAAVPATVVKFSSVHIEAPAAADGLFIVDGQQRMTALTGALMHPATRPRGDIHAIWYDLVEERFERLAHGEPPMHWIPLNRVADSFHLLAWLNAWPLQKERPDLTKRAIALGKALREYQAPAYIVEGANEATLRLIFKRANTSGVAMKESEVFEALFGTKGRPLTAACARLEELGFGAIGEDDFLEALKAVEGIDPRHRFRDNEQDIQVGTDAIERTEVALQRAIRFLVSVAEIPHIKLLPYRLPLRILARFFHIHPTPDTRTELLLSRWVWRGALSRQHADNGDSIVNALQQSIGEDARDYVEWLLFHSAHIESVDVLEAPWNGRNASSRLFALALFALRPKLPETGEIVTTELLQEWLADADLSDVFLPLFSASSNVGRVLIGSRDRLEALLRPSIPSEVLRSHGYDVPTLTGVDSNFLYSLRCAGLYEWTERYFHERTGYGDSDRPAIAALVAEAGSQK